jgi:hypothetical protein
MLRGLNENECDFQFHRSDPLKALHPSPEDCETSSECRCLCGSLLARVVPEGVELRCRRCKRTLLVPVEAGAHLQPASDGTPRFIRVEARDLREAG